MRKLGLLFIGFIIGIVALPGLSGKATVEQSEVLLGFNKTSFSAGEVIELSVYGHGFLGLFGFQIDLTDNEQPYDIIMDNSKYYTNYDELFSDPTDTIWVNQFQNGVASFIITRNEEKLNGYDATETIRLLTIHLMANETVDDIYQLFQLSDDYLDLELGSAQIILKLADIEGNPIPWNYVLDSEAPTIAPISEITTNVFDDIPDVSTLITVQDNYDPNPVIRTNIQTIVNNQMIGTYLVNISVFDAFGHVTSIDINVHVVDIIPPILTLIGDSEITLELGQMYIDPGVSVIDNYDQSIIYTIEGSVNTDAIGTYAITYQATDSSGNKATSLTRTIEVINTYPKVALNPGIDTIYQHQTHSDQGVQIIYNQTYEVSTINLVDASTVGVYLITYTVAYDTGSIIVKRYVHVIPSQPEIIFSLLPGLSTLLPSDTFIDEGCEVTVNGESEICAVIENNINLNVPGVYTVVYGVVVEDVTYTHVRYVRVISSLNRNVIFYRKDEEI